MFHSTDFFIFDFPRLEDLNFFKIWLDLAGTPPAHRIPNERFFILKTTKKCLRSWKSARECRNHSGNLTHRKFEHFYAKKDFLKNIPTPKKNIIFPKSKNLDFFFWKKSRVFFRKMKNWKSEFFSRFPKKIFKFSKNPKFLKISKNLSFWNFSKKILGNRFQ